MAFCDTEVYSDSTGTRSDSLLEASPILAGKGSRREGKTSPRLGQRRRSSRIRKRDGSSRSGCSDASDSSSDDSDPNIQMSDDVLIADEEKMMMNDEAEMDDRANQQILAVALIKSVMETKATEVPSGLSKVKLENASDGMIKQNGKTENDSIKKEADDEGIGCVDENMTDISQSNCPNITQECDEKVGMNYGQPYNDPETGIKVENSIDMTDNTNIHNDTSTIVSMTKSSKAQVSHSSGNTKTAAYCSTRSRTKGAKNGRTMALKGAYASIREAPRVPRNPSVSLPVPNPILPSPAPKEFGATSELTHEEVVDKTIPTSSNGYLSTTSSAVAVSSDSSNTQDENAPQQAVATNHPGNPNHTSRRRFFSIDLDRKFMNDSTVICKNYVI